MKKAIVMGLMLYQMKVKQHMKVLSKSSWKKILENVSLVNILQEKTF
ncbi:hypothetical protein SAMN02745176_03294 [Lutispora thermophila DSM 19022]|uniref:Uncharacterized protein n=1 Tax=Lutispora thermophila DSM 19022 TaxID=1122184 RepID=A0A1M6IJS1_9FIRM|nr:hypothetical protein SAMN02745176_03294 [Lutispora thermophila DSM 19022]